jgi:anti-sigma regulatory factor (Ser/Thr protein kinase)
VRDALARAGHVDEADTAEVLTSELVTNAVRHADGDRVGVDVQSDGMVRVAVADETQALPVLQHAGSLDTQGRGIAMVNQLARRWGVELRAGGGKVVWFELSARRAAAAVNRVRAAIRGGVTATSSLVARVRKARKTASPTGND